MRKLIAITLLLFMVMPCLKGQKKEISQARHYIKSGKDLDKAENLMVDLLASDSVNRLNTKIYQTWYLALQKQYDIENEKLYLKQKCDTVAVYDVLQKIFRVVFALDSVDALPDVKGRIRPKYRKDNAETLDGLRPNLFYGGTFYINKVDYKKAYSFFDTYIDCVGQPLFNDYNYKNEDDKQIEAAYWATYCGFKSGVPEYTLKYADLAIKDTVKAQYTLSYIAEAYKQRDDTQNYLRVLKEGFERYPLFSYFFPRLQDYYISIGQNDEALRLTDFALAQDTDNELFLFAKSSILLNLGRNEECIAVSDTLIKTNASLPEPYFNAGTAYVNLAIEQENNINKIPQNKAHKQRSDKLKNHRNRLNEYYRKALPYMEMYRKLASDEEKKWAPMLYKIYLNLNMGKQFDEIDAILNRKHY